MKKLWLTKNIILIITLIFLFSLGSCKKKQAKTPVDIIEKEKMVSILVDVNLVEASARANQPKTENDTLQTVAFYKEIFKKNKITKAQFDNSIKYYSKNPEKFGEIYDEVINKLSRMQTEVVAKK